MFNRTFAVACAAALLLSSYSAAAAAADGNVYYLAEVGTSDRPLVVAVSDRGLVFIGADNQVFRGFHHEQQSAENGQSPMWIEDIDSDNRLEFVGAGEPSFVVDDNGDPKWGVLRGCDNFFLGDFLDDRTPEVFCRRGASVEVWSHDGQSYFEWSGRGFRIEECYMDDFDGDNKQEVACTGSRDSHLMFDLAFTEPEERDGAFEIPASGTGVRPSDGLTQVDGSTPVSTGAGTFTVTAGSDSVTVSAGGTPVATAPVRGATSATVADLDGDGTAEIYIGASDRVYVVSAGTGEVVATIDANPNNLRRQARTAVDSISSNGLSDNEEQSLRAAVEDAMDDVQSCYERSMGTDQFTRVGRMMWELRIGSGGRVSNTQKIHSSIRNRDLESCVEDALEDARFASPTDDSGSVTATIGFDFVDVAR